MNNPYRSERMRAWRYQNVLLYRLGLLVLLPKFAVWSLDEKLSAHSWWIRVRPVLVTLTAPVRKLWAFVKLWLSTRPWSRLWLASPVLVFIVLGVAISFLKTKRGGGAGEYASYYQGAMEAFRQGDVKKADHLFGKIIDHEKYRDVDEVLLRALISAKRSDNKARVEQLYQKLVVERDYVPAKHWMVDDYISRKQYTAEKTAAYKKIAMELSAVSVGDVEDFWRWAWAKLLLLEGNHDEAVNVLTCYENRSPKSSWLLISIYKDQRERTEALKEISQMLQFIEDNDPELNLYLSESVKGLLLQADYTLIHDETVEYVRKAVSLVERKRLEVDKSEYSVMVGKLYVILSKRLMEYYSLEGRAEAFDFIDKAVRLTPVPVGVGDVLNSILDEDSANYLTPDQIEQLAQVHEGVTADLLGGLMRWRNGEEDSARVIFRETAKKTRKAFVALRTVAHAIADIDEAGDLQQAFAILDLVEDMEVDQAAGTLFDRCKIFFTRSAWQEIVDLVKPRLEGLEKEDLIEGCRWLAIAHRKLGNVVKAKEYEKTLYDEMLKMRR